MFAERKVVIHLFLRWELPEGALPPADEEIIDIVGEAFAGNGVTEIIEEVQYEADCEASFTVDSVES